MKPPPSLPPDTKSVIIRGTVAVVVLVVALLRPARGATVTGTVREVGDGIAVVEPAGGSPAAGDGAKFFFKLPGTDEEVSVADGLVLGAEDGATRIKIENATGEVTKDQLVRFESRGGSLENPASPPGYVGLDLGNQKGASGAVVLNVLADSPAARAGLQPRDLIVAADGSPIASAEELAGYVAKLKVGTPHSFSVSRAGSVQKFETIIAARPASEVPDKALALADQGAAQLTAGDAAGAADSLTAALEIAPNLAIAYLNRANARLAQTIYQSAIADATKALELKVPQAADAYTIRGTAKASLGDYEGGIADCNRAIEINPQYALAYNNRANNKIYLRHYKDALADAELALKLDPNLPLGWYNRGIAHAHLEHWPEALRDWKKVVSLQPTFALELNPKIAQLEAQGVSAKPATPAKTAPPADGWVDLTNAPKKLVGTWEGGRHRTKYSADGTFVVDPHLVPDPPPGRWEIQGDSLVEIAIPANITVTSQILSLDAKTLVLRNAQGETFKFTKLE